MKRKILISFLGIGKYESCVYHINNKESKVVTYVQSAIIELLANNFDKYLIFCTKEALKNNFNNLKKESGKDLKHILIPVGSSEDEIWEIFKIINECLKQGDEVIYDITHSFRSLPMLGMTLLNYAKFIKGIKVLGIYYGAFENLGNKNEIKAKYPCPEPRKAPILNLTSFSLLHDWTIAGNNFLKLGNSEMLKKLTIDQLTPILKDTKGKNKDANRLRNIMKMLENISLNFRTNRGKEILAGDLHVKAYEQINEIEGVLIKPFKPILKKVNLELEPFEKNNYCNAGGE